MMGNKVNDNGLLGETVTVCDGAREKVREEREGSLGNARCKKGPDDHAL